MNEEIIRLKRLIEDLKKRLPAHSIPPSMMAELDEMEEKLAIEIKKVRQTHQDQKE
jgi:hypothetical protein